MEKAPTTAHKPPFATTLHSSSQEITFLQQTQKVLIVELAPWGLAWARAHRLTLILSSLSERTEHGAVIQRSGQYQADLSVD